MKATLVRMDVNSLTFRCENDSTRILMSARPGTTNPKVEEYRLGANVHWISDDGSHRGNTTTLAQIKKTDAYMHAVNAVHRRMAELEAQYAIDHSMYAARCEVHQSWLRETLDELRNAVLSDSGCADADGKVASAAHAYYKAVSAPTPPQNPWAHNARRHRLAHEQALADLSRAEQGGQD